MINLYKRSLKLNTANSPTESLKRGFFKRLLSFGCFRPQRAMTTSLPRVFRLCKLKPSPMKAITVKEIKLISIERESFVFTFFAICRWRNNYWITKGDFSVQQNPNLLYVLILQWDRPLSSRLAKEFFIAVRKKFCLIIKSNQEEPSRERSAARLNMRNQNPAEIHRYHPFCLQCLRSSRYRIIPWSFTFRSPVTLIVFLLPISSRSIHYENIEFNYISHRQKLRKEKKNLLPGPFRLTLSNRFLYPSMGICLFDETRENGTDDISESRASGFFMIRNVHKSQKTEGIKNVLNNKGEEEDDEKKKGTNELPLDIKT